VPARAAGIPEEGSGEAVGGAIETAVGDGFSGGLVGDAVSAPVQAVTTNAHETTNLEISRG
jgi:hypothetical protein